MFVETAVFDREDCLHHPRRDDGERDRPFLLALGGVAERGQHRRVERQPLARLAAEIEREHVIGRTRRRRLSRRRPYVRRRLTLEDDTRDLAVEFGSARRDRDDAGAGGELTGLGNGGALRVAEIVEAIDQLAIGEQLTAPQLERTGENA